MRRAAVLAVLLAAAPAAAQEDSDLDRIPSTIGSAPAAVPSDISHGKYYVENDVALSSHRGTFVVPYPVAAASPWADRVSIDGLDQWALANDLTLSVSDRFNLTFARGMGFPGESARNDLREAYFTWQPYTGSYLEAGRINVRNGVALGFNPTDFFKARTLVSQASADPSALREDRLGTVMLRGQQLWDGGSLTLIYAPKLEDAAPIGVVSHWYEPKFDQTNTSDRFLASLNLEIGELSPQALVYRDGSRTKFGLNISQPIGQSVIAYAEWAGGNQSSLIADAIAFGKRTGTIPAIAPLLPPTGAGRSFRNELAAGASWTSIEKVTINVEYHFHEAGLSSADWHDWFALGTDPVLAPEFWYERAYASDVQQPASRHQLFVRADWQDAFILHLELTAFTLTNPSDGSTLGQLAASYILSDNWSIGAYLSGTLGGRRTEWGSSPGAASAIFQLTRYF